MMCCSQSVQQTSFGAIADRSRTEIDRLKWKNEQSSAELHSAKEKHHQALETTGTCAENVQSPYLASTWSERSCSWIQQTFEWLNEIDNSKNIGDLEASKPITGQRKGDVEYLDAKVSSGLEKISNGDLKRRVLMEVGKGTKRKISHTPSDGLDDIRGFQNQRHRRISLGSR